jgi:hypothetical protein
MLTGEGGVQVYYVQAVTALFFPARRVKDGIFRINRTLVELSLS